MSTGRHLDRLPHRLAAEGTLEAPLRLLQELVIKPGHGCTARRWTSVGAAGWREPNVLWVSQTALGSRGCVAALLLSRGRRHITSSSAKRQIGNVEGAQVCPSWQQQRWRGGAAAPGREAIWGGFSPRCAGLQLWGICGRVWPDPGCLLCGWGADTLSTMHNPSVCWGALSAASFSSSSSTAGGVKKLRRSFTLFYLSDLSL